MTWVVRGLAAGALAGLAAGLLALAIAEPSIERAIAYEEMHAAAAIAGDAGEGDEHGLSVTRGGQKAGLVLATGLWGVALGLIVALVYTGARSRMRVARDGIAALLVSGALFLALAAVPFLKYSPNPPGVGDPATATRRNLLWLAMVAISLVAVLAATRLSALTAPRLHRRLGFWARPIAWGAVFGAIALAAAIAMPTVQEVPDDFPADLLWEFRGAALAVQAFLWGALALVFAVLVDRGGTSGARAS